MAEKESINQSINQSYLADNKEYWEKGYNAPNVDHHTFRFFGRILKPEFRLPRDNEKLLDFGCGQGAAVRRGRWFSLYFLRSEVNTEMLYASRNYRLRSR